MNSDSTEPPLNPPNPNSDATVVPVSSGEKAEIGKNESGEQNLERKIEGEESGGKEEKEEKEKKEEEKEGRNIALSEYKNNAENARDRSGKGRTEKRKKDLNKSDLAFSSYHTKKRRRFKDKAEEEQAINSTILRFTEEDKKRKENLEKIRKRIADDESKTCYKIPKINKYSKEITSRINEDFLTRQKKLEEKHRKLHEFLEQKRMEEIKFGKGGKNGGKKEKVEGRKKEKRTKEELNKTINKLYDWDKKRKERIAVTQKKRQQKEIAKVKSCPDINKKSKDLVARQNPKRTVQGTFERLYKGDNAKKKERLKILTQIYTPSFKPKINSVRNNSAKFNSNKSQILKNSASNSCIMSVDVEDIWRSKIMGKMNKSNGKTTSARKY